MKGWIVARKYLVEMLREPQLLGLSLALPLFFVLITAVGYGRTPRLATYKVMVQNQAGVGTEFIQVLRDRRYPDGRPVFNVLEVKDLVEVDAAMKSQKAAALVIFGRDQDGKLALTLRGDGTSLAFTIASQHISKALGPELDRALGKPPALKFVEEPLSVHGSLSEFDAYTPGMIVFAILLLIPQTAMLVGRELRSGTFKRMQISSLKPLEYLGGICLAQMVIALIQVVLVFAFALALGFHNQGSLLAAIGLALMLSFSSIGLGLLMAAFVRNDSDALNGGSVLSMLQVFLSGAFFPISSPSIFKLGERTLYLFDLIPATHGMLALQQVMVSGAGWSVVGFRTLMMGVLSVLYFAVSVLAFKLLRMRAGH